MKKSQRLIAYGMTIKMALEIQVLLIFLMQIFLQTHLLAKSLLNQLNR